MNLVMFTSIAKLGHSLGPLALIFSVNFLHLCQDLPSRDAFVNFCVLLQVGRGKALAHFGVKSLKLLVLVGPGPLGILILTLAHDVPPFRTYWFTIIDQKNAGKRACRHL